MNSRTPDDSDFEILEIIDLNDTGPVRRPVPGAARPGSTPAPCSGTPASAVPFRAREKFRNEAACALLRDLLPSFDALESCVRERPDAATLEQGVRLALRSMWNAFRTLGLERIEGDGVPFDPRIHEAGEITPSGRVPVNTVLDTLRVGYTLGGELVRPALVRVSVASTEPSSGDEPDSASPAEGTDA
jgi:molecular chaperone GrpE